MCSLSLYIYIYIHIHTAHILFNTKSGRWFPTMLLCLLCSWKYGWVRIQGFYLYMICICNMYIYIFLYHSIPREQNPLFVVPVDGKEFSQEKQLPAKQNLPSWWLVVAASQRRFWLLNSCLLKNFSAAITCSSGKYKLEAKEVGMGIGKNLRPRRQILVHFKLSTLILRHA